MKPKKVEKKLFLNKKTVANLGNQQMSGLRGGQFTGDTVEVCCYTKTCTASCATCYTDCDQDSCEICTLCTRPITGCA